MWQRFTDRARKVILLAQEEARRLKSSSVGTEHLLLGLIGENEGIAANVLQRMNVALPDLRAAVERASAPAKDEVTHPGLSPRAKRVLELAAEEARRMKHNYIGSEHLLLSLIRAGKSTASRVLHELGVEIDKARSAVEEYLGARGNVEEEVGSG